MSDHSTKRRWDAWDYLVLSGILLVSITLLTGMIIAIVQDERAKSKCHDAGHSVVESQHGNGWDCVSDDVERRITR